MIPKLYQKTWEHDVPAAGPLTSSVFPCPAAPCLRFRAAKVSCRSTSKLCHPAPCAFHTLSAQYIGDCRAWYQPQAPTAMVPVVLLWYCGCEGWSGYYDAPHGLTSRTEQSHARTLVSLVLGSEVFRKGLPEKLPVSKLTWEIAPAMESALHLAPALGSCMKRGAETTWRSRNSYS